MRESTSKTGRHVGLTIGLAVVAVAGCSPPPTSTTAEPAGTHPLAVAASGPAKIASDHLPNPVRLHERVISGGLPEGDAAFQELAELGVKTIISVDGMTPDVETAARFGLRYVHLPHGYDGVPAQRAKELAKAVRDLEGPIYIHCHHGKHRSPAAASVACVTAGLIPSAQAIPILELAGTNPSYQGLYTSAREASALDAALLDELQVEFREVQEIPPMAEAMVHLSHALDRLQLIADSGWKSPPTHPDLDPAHEALLIRELYTELLRTDEVAGEAEDFRGWLHDSEVAARKLEAALQEWQADEAYTTPSSKPPRRVSELAERISANCKACHAKYRDTPLSEQ